MDWERAERRHEPGTPEFRVFNGIKKLIDLRKASPELADFDTREILEHENIHVLAFVRWNLINPSQKTLVLSNFSDAETSISCGILERDWPRHEQRHFIDKVSLCPPEMRNGQIVLPPYGFMWLQDEFSLPV
jgi:amylosucrase